MYTRNLEKPMIDYEIVVNRRTQERIDDYNLSNSSLVSGLSPTQNPTEFCLIVTLVLSLLIAVIYQVGRDGNISEWLERKPSDWMVILIFCLLNHL